MGGFAKSMNCCYIVSNVDRLLAMDTYVSLRTRIIHAQDAPTSIRLSDRPPFTPTQVYIVLSCLATSSFSSMRCTRCSRSNSKSFMFIVGTNKLRGKSVVSQTDTLHQIFIRPRTGAGGELTERL